MEEVHGGPETLGVQGVQAFNLGLPILTEELNRKPASRRAKA
jgi:hypothetical protein